MYLEAKETARLYQLLSDKLGNDTTEVLFKYIDSKTERAVEATVKSLATKDDLATLKYELSKDISDVKAGMIKWMFIFWVGTIGVLSGIIFAMLHANLKKV